jgi:hypothetical protein
LLRPGAYVGFGVGDHSGFTVPAGWSWNGRTLHKGGAAISFFAPPLLVYADPCHWDQAQHPLVEPALASPEVIVSELAAQPMRYATRPNGLPYNNVAIRLTTPSNLDISSCDHGQYRTWGTGASTLHAQSPGQRDLIWIQNYGGGNLIVDAATDPDTPAQLVHQVDGILASVSICGPCG